MTTTQNIKDYQSGQLSATSLIGDNVVNTQGESLGEIKEFMLDLETGGISYAVLSFGGFLGMGDKLFAVPFEALRVDNDNERFILDVPKDKLKNAPGFDEDNWPSHANSTFINKVYNHYGYGDYREYNERIYGKYENGRYKNRYANMNRANMAAGSREPAARSTDEAYRDRVERSREKGMMDVVDKDRNGV